jgi:hypothetical protein
MELIAIVLLWIPKTEWYALVLVLGMMSGAIASHVFVLGIEIKGDGGELFILGIVTWVAAAALLIIKKEETKAMVLKFLGKRHVV